MKGRRQEESDKIDHGEGEMLERNEGQGKESERRGKDTMSRIRLIYTGNNERKRRESRVRDRAFG